MLYQKSSKGNKESALLRTGSSLAISEFSISFSFTSYFPGQNRKFFKGWRIVATYEFFLDRRQLTAVNLLLFKSPESAHCIHEYTSSKHQNKKFIVEHGNIGSHSFLDVKICRKIDKFVTSVKENQHLTEFSPILKVPFQRSKRGAVTNITSQEF